MSLLRRPIFAFALGAALAAAVAGGTAAYGALTDDRVAACYVPKTGALYVVGRDGAPARCADGHTPIDWSIRGPQGPAGTFSGAFTSPNGQYSISVTDAGIVLAGPGSAVRLTGANVVVESALATTVQAGSAFSVASAGTAALQAGTSLALASGNGTSLQAGKDLAVAAGTNLGVTVGGATTVDGGHDVTIEADGRATLRGLGSVVVESPGKVTVKGSIVQANKTLLP
jgi:hypothetical protein